MGRARTLGGPSAGPALWAKRKGAPTANALKGAEAVSKELAELTVVTESRLKMWYLTRMRGYRIRRRQQVPQVSLFGRIGYRRQWMLARSR